MNVASRELCQELYELSGWDCTRFHFEGGCLLPSRQIWSNYDKNELRSMNIVPAYDLGYLLRKLPKTSAIMHGSHEGEWEAYSVSRNHKATREYADTPEDATAKLAIAFIKSGVIMSSAQAPE